ncbi:MAG TPA: hypothetical protein VLD19_09260, partial [Chitinophagaceae bacterium]|nr:hypothetical protein [Chitinophagaceae bacterium]
MKLKIVSLLLLAGNLTFAQKVDLDRYNFQGSYRSLPQKPLDASYKTFSVRVEATSSVKDGFSEGSMIDAVNIEGLKKLTGNAHINLYILFDDLMIEKADVKERIDEKKDKEGKVTSKTSYYSVEVIYSFAGRASITDYKGSSIVSNWTLADRGSKQTYNTSEYSTYSDAAKYYNNNKYELRNQFTRQSVTAALQSFTNSLNANYGYPARRDADILWILDSKKHPEQASQQAAWATFKETISTVTADEISPEARAKLLSLVQYFDSVKVKYAGTDKADKKMRYSSFYNNAKIYLYLDNPEAAIKEADGLLANDYDTGDAKYLKRLAEDMLASFKRNNINSRHFHIDLASVEGPKQ